MNIRKSKPITVIISGSGCYTAVAQQIGIYCIKTCCILLYIRVSSLLQLNDNTVSITTLKNYSTKINLLNPNGYVMHQQV